MIENLNSLPDHPCDENPQNVVSESMTGTSTTHSPQLLSYDHSSKVIDKMSFLPPDYLERVYAGVLGKIIGVLLGRPFEMWSHQRILDELGPIKYYVHDKLGVPLVVIDDDISGTFTFVRALEEHGAKADLSAKEVGKTWLNNVIEKKCVFWWGGNGISTEHTAFRNLKKGISAPDSGSVKTNGRTVAEQIGAQIFIDGWALVAPGQPELAARLADAAATVSHDGEAVYAAKLWAAMEAEAFVSGDVDHLLDTGLKFVPSDSLIAHLIADVRGWCKKDDDWKKTRQRIEAEYGYHKYPGVCHVIPNHGIMIMALIYAGHNFHEAMHIINTSGWDTDCNSGNVGCLVAISNGLKAFERGPDWRGPVADRAIISSADGGYSINNAARIAFDLANAGRSLAGEDPIPPPKDGAQFHFSLPGSVQGFQLTPSADAGTVKVEQDMNSPIGPALVIQITSLLKGTDPVEVMTDTFIPKDVLEHKRDYELMASPLLYPGQKVTAVVVGADWNTGPVSVCLRLRAYDPQDRSIKVDGPVITLSPGRKERLAWELPQAVENQPICKVGLAISPAQDGPVSGTVYLDALKYHGTPRMTLRRPSTGPADISGEVNMWHCSFVTAVDVFHTWGPSFFIAHDHGEGMISTGTRDWHNYKVTVSKLTVNLGAPAGLAARVRGLNRWYALMFCRNGRVALIKAKDEESIELTGMVFDWKLDEEYELSLEVDGSSIRGRVGELDLEAKDHDYESGGIGLIVTDGSLSAESLVVEDMDCVR